jgi:hypothetical protein
MAAITAKNAIFSGAALKLLGRQKHRHSHECRFLQSYYKHYLFRDTAYFRQCVLG